MSDVISCDGWSDSGQEHTALISHCMNTLSYCNSWQLSLGAYGNGMTWPWWCYDTQRRHSFGVWVYTHSKMTINTSCSSGNKKPTSNSYPLSQFRYTEDDLKILLRILFLKLDQNFFLSTHFWPVTICLDTDCHNHNMHTRRKSSPLEIWFSLCYGELWLK